MKKIRILQVGLGLIGGTLLAQIKEEMAELVASGCEIRVVGLANSQKMVFDQVGVDLADWKARLAGGQVVDLEKMIAEAAAMKADNESWVLVDCTASEAMTEVYGAALGAGLSVVTPNKKACSGDFTVYESLKKLASQKGVKFLYETNVGAGLPIIGTLQDLRKTGDQIVKIEAILSGTLSYIFNTFDQTMKFSEVVKGAQEKGYTEPDPRDDLNGMDVARKILILAREAGHMVEMKDVEVESLVPESAREVESVDEFFAALAAEDGVFAEKMAEAVGVGKVLRYIASFEKGKAKVSLQAVGADHPFYAMAGSDNIVSFMTKRYCETPLVVKGPGAGAEVTAAGVFADLLKV